MIYDTVITAFTCIDQDKHTFKLPPPAFTNINRQVPPNKELSCMNVDERKHAFEKSNNYFPCSFPFLYVLLL